MKPFAIAAILVAILGVGIYIGVSGLVTQYAFVPGRSIAGAAVCTPEVGTISSGAVARFVASNLPVDAPYHWSSDEGQAAISTGKFSVRYNTVGTKTVSLFYFSRNAWLRTTCQVQVR